MDSDLFKSRNLSDDEETIAKTINYLRLNDPVNANRDYAVGFLGYMQRVAYGVEKRQAYLYRNRFENPRKKLATRGKRALPYSK